MFTGNSTLRPTLPTSDPDNRQKILKRLDSWLWGPARGSELEDAIAGEAFSDERLMVFSSKQSARAGSPNGSADCRQAHGNTHAYVADALAHLADT